MHPHLAEGAVVSSESPSVRSAYSTRSCRRCGVAMTPVEDVRSRHRWTCPTCGRSER